MSFKSIFILASYPTAIMPFTVQIQASLRSDILHGVHVVPMPPVLPPLPSSIRVVRGGIRIKKGSHDHQMGAPRLVLVIRLGLWVSDPRILHSNGA